MAEVAGPEPIGVFDASSSDEYFSTGPYLHGRPVVAIYTAEGGGVRAGSFLYVEPDVEILIGGNHRIDWVATFPVREVYGLPGTNDGTPWSKGDIVIGHGVRLGRGTRILSGVTIGDGALVAPDSVVVRDVRPYAVVAGNPARETRLRFDARRVERLAQETWWEWPEDVIVVRLDRLTGGQAHTLVPQLGRQGPRLHPMGARGLTAHFMRERAHKLDEAATPAGVLWAKRLRRWAERVDTLDSLAPPESAQHLSVADAAGETDPAPPADSAPPTDPAPPAPPETRAGLPLNDTTHVLTLEEHAPSTIPMGRGSYGWPTVRGPTQRVTVGSYCSIAPGVAIVVESPDELTPSGAEPATHGGRPQSPNGSGQTGRRGTGAGLEVRLGNDVWVGRAATILSGVTVGDGAVIAAYAVVGKDVRPYAVVAGDPAREVKRRFDDPTVDALMRIRWWEWPEDMVKDRAPELCSEDVAGFVVRYDSAVQEAGSRTTP